MKQKGEPMSILIKGMEKPMSCDDCIVPLSKCDFLQRRADECPIVEIPTSHGDLIDRDIVRDECYKTMGELIQSTTINISAEALSLLCGFTIINNVPTIIESED